MSTGVDTVVVELCVTVEPSDDFLTKLVSTVCVKVGRPAERYVKNLTIAPDRKMTPTALKFSVGTSRPMPFAAAMPSHVTTDELPPVMTALSSPYVHVSICVKRRVAFVKAVCVFTSIWLVVLVLAFG